MARNRRRRRDAVTNRRLPTSQRARRSDNQTEWSFRDPFNRRSEATYEYVSQTNPRRFRLPANVNQRNTRIVRGYAPTLTRGTLGGVQSSPRKIRTTSLCESRREREEVLHAKGLSGRRGQKPPIWTQKSKVRCK